MLFSRLLSSIALIGCYKSIDAAAAENVLFIMADQMRWDTISERYTPNLFKLRSQGLEMKNTYSSTPSCTPARSALLTGLSPWYNGMLGYGEIAPQVSLLSSHTTLLFFHHQHASSLARSELSFKPWFVRLLAKIIKDEISSRPSNAPFTFPLTAIFSV